MNQNKPIAICIFAPSCSGKSTFMNQVKKDLDIYKNLISGFDIGSDRHSQIRINDFNDFASGKTIKVIENQMCLIHIDINYMFGSKYFGFNSFNGMIKILEDNFSKFYFTVLVTSQKQYDLRQTWRGVSHGKPPLLETWNKFFDVYHSYFDIYPILKIVLSLKQQRYRIIPYEKTKLINKIS